MVIYLPLLFADGNPTSLERATAAQLEKFIPFMLDCCPDRPSVNTSIRPPSWWPFSIPYQFPLSPNCNPQQWLAHLKEVICRCYEYYGCEHVLRFCSRLADLPPGFLRYKENSQGFISIYNKASNKLIVTFKKKNQIYDRQAGSPTKPSLLPRKPKGPPKDQQIEDIYLCNYCDEEFTCAKNAVHHEGVCKGKIDQEVQNEEVDQASAMRYFGLGLSDSCRKEGGEKRKTSLRLTARSYMSIPVSSPLGRKMSSNVSPLKEADKMEYIQKLESCCGSQKLINVSSLPKRTRKFGVVHHRTSRKKFEHRWTHTYCFNRAQREERKITLRTGLNKRARLLLKKCKKAIVLLERLPLLDPLALHAAAALDYQNRLKSIPCDEPLFQSIDLVSDDECCDNVIGRESFSYEERSADSFFNSSSDHKRSLKDWSPVYHRTLPHTSLLPIAPV
ncbi:DNA-binding protein Ewg [Frankliniella fusca]|uniref:DNA-binding protein Ewg n=1 Tax=Frankliniella fusca TaxID=407009 RepID=A0AAE1H4S2_9NEOP|nr:DNA-binding protein Ewg [Frankliniella fusca]